MGVLNVTSSGAAIVECQQQQQQQQQQNKKNDTIFSPIKNKMKVLKKIKKRMGLATRSASSCPGPNNLPPLQFHTVHGDNIRISREGTVAKRYESFCKGITFSARPVRVNERVCVKFLDISNNWSGVIRFGFTCNDPASLRGNLPKYACPDLTNKPGFWAKALNERYCYRGNVLFYYVTPSGDVHFGINGEEKGVFITDVDARGPLWAVIDVYGNSTAIEFLDSRIYMFQAQQQQHQQQQQQQQQHHQQQHHGHPQGQTRRPTEQEISVPHLESLSINQHNHQLMEERPTGCGALSPSTSARYHHNPPSPSLVPLPFHPVRGRNIKFSADRYVATRADTEFCQGYVFSPRPIKIGEKLIIEILKTDSIFVGSLALGLTSCDPASLQLNDLPDDSDMLLDRPEYWVVSKDVASTLVRGDELCFCVTVNGEVQISKNGGPPSVVMHIDQSLQLWAFLDVYGSTQSVRLFSYTMLSPTVTSSCAANLYEARSHSSLASVTTAATSQSVRSLHQVQQQAMVESAALAGASCRTLAGSSSTTALVQQSTTATTATASVRPDMIQINPGGTVLVVNLPPADVLSQQQQQASQPQATIVTRGLTTSASTLSVPLSTLSLSSHTGSTGTASELMASNNNSANYAASSSAYPETLSSYNNAANYSTAALAANGGIYSSTNCVDCTICFEKPIDSVLYMCGHMCMCYDCAIKQWRGIGGGHCPLCRAVIRDVIRTYKS
ncbi:protein neuralized [Anopheles nili]|uniref:protein neuralized n=1 Tax=Anopheles nili TaxID=185578 RepID=UPI00237AC3FA|nr:protein neuralized [Anopheles nili]